MSKNTDPRSAAEMAYAKRRGWKLARRAAGLGEIAAGSRDLKDEEYALEPFGPMFDHASYYDWKGTQRPAAIIAHPYQHITPAQLEAFARAYGLRWEIVEPTLYHHPRAQTIVLYAERYQQSVQKSRAAAMRRRLQWIEMQRRRYGLA